MVIAVLRALSYAVGSVTVSVVTAASFTITITVAVIVLQENRAHVFDSLERGIWV